MKFESSKDKFKQFQEGFTDSPMGKIRRLRESSKRRQAELEEKKKKKKLEEME